MLARNKKLKKNVKCRLQWDTRLCHENHLELRKEKSPCDQKPHEKKH